MPKFMEYKITLNKIARFGLHLPLFVKAAIFFCGPVGIDPHLPKLVIIFSEDTFTKVHLDEGGQFEPFS